MSNHHNNLQHSKIFEYIPLRRSARVVPPLYWTGWSGPTVHSCTKRKKECRTITIIILLVVIAHTY